MALPDKLKGLERPTTTVKVCLQPDLVDEYERLTSRPRNSLGDSTAARRLELEEQIREATIVFTLRALPRREWTKLLAEHPPTEGVKEQEAVGYNAETFYEALVRRSVVDPELDAEAWDALDDVLTEGHWQRLWLSAQQLNIRPSELPFV